MGEASAASIFWSSTRGRTIIGSATPNGTAIPLVGDARLPTAEFFLELRELGVLNIGGQGEVTAGGIAHPLSKIDALYIGRRTRLVEFASDDVSNPARFFLMSYLAHSDFATTPAPASGGRQVPLGTSERANVCTARQPSCLLARSSSNLEGSCAISWCAALRFVA
jgi:5-keto 4-deoxyuronate isomerase